MTAALGTIHPWLGYLVSVVALGSAMVAFRSAKDASEFRAGPYSTAMVLLDIQVTLGLVLYAVGGYWEARPEVAYLHPALALAALGIGHGLVGRAKRTQLAVEAHRSAGRGLLGALLFVLLSIGVASAPPFLP
ncbi:MAG: hypothetical protein ACLFUG_01230 [Nitriliruptoraceae bacterium]